MPRTKSTRPMVERLESRRVLSLILGSGADLELDAKGPPSGSPGGGNGNGKDGGGGEEPADLGYGHWEDGDTDTPVVDVTFSFTPDGAPMESGDGNNALQGTLNAIFGPADWKSIVRDALQEWADVSNLNFVEKDGTAEAFNTGVEAQASDAGTSGQGQIRIAGHAFDGSSGVLAHAYYPVAANSPTARGDAHFDIAEAWNGSIDLFTVALHEFGHSLGLPHAKQKDCKITARSIPVMCATYRGPVTGLHGKDIEGIQQIYPPTGTTGANSTDSRHGHSAAMESVEPPVLNLSVGATRNPTPTGRQSLQYTRAETHKPYAAGDELTGWLESSQRVYAPRPTTRHEFGEPDEPSESEDLPWNLPWMDRSNTQSERFGEL